MMIVKQATRKDVCVLCGQEIRPGTIFILSRRGKEGGGTTYEPSHLLCRVQQREAERRMEAARS